MLTNKPSKLLSSLLIGTAIIASLNFTSTTYAASNSHQLKSAVTKIAGKKTYNIYGTINSNGPRYKIGNTKDFKYSHLESKEYTKTKKGTYWLLIINGRSAGWVNQNFFARSQLSFAKHVNLVNNNYKFLTRDAINYVTSSTGTLINPYKVHISKTTIESNESGEHKITYKYGNAKKDLVINVSNDKSIGVTHADIQPDSQVRDYSSWSGSSISTSPNWNAEHHYASETRANHYTSANKQLELNTRLYQPHFLSLRTKQNDFISQVGAIPQGLTVYNNQAVVSTFASSKRLHGYLVNYNLNKLTNLYDTQNLITMPWKQFQNYNKQIKVSPYLKLGHGQAIGSTDKYIYVLANNNQLKNSSRSEELMQIRKSDMGLNQVWTIKVWNGSSKYPRYFHNATFVNDHVMYGLFHNASKHRYEYWKLEKHDNQWIPTEVGATNSDFINNSPVQGFTYDKNHDEFYIGFNDYIFNVSGQGEFLNDYQFDSKRELEGMSVNNGKLFTQLAKRPEILQAEIN